ncbi:ABC transporter ATP-binding protein [Okeanomitos corallinicola TIOX110]|uniref:Spermidine/putrescine import ATP-binding protein PotA n=1 Tax=Okeanomitos corallinicola TIOX110 TaxID=3133117 RepID=A0ABZ2UWA3_9CYAN
MAQTAMQNQRSIPNFQPLDVELRNVFKFFNQEPAVHGVDLDVKQGEFFSILGPSGCGKTTILRLIAGFERLDAGKLLIQGQSMTDVPAYKRPINTVFQSYALFNHLNVWDNIAFGLRLQKLSKLEVDGRVGDALKLVKMDSLRSRFPSHLSGGQQQRVALARALVNRPAVLLLDEPLGALDLKLRKEMQCELSNIQKNLGVTFIMVTHDQQEALSLSDRIAVMNQGKIEQVGTPSEIYERPQTSFVADFIGDTNLFSGELTTIDIGYVKVLTKSGLSIIAVRPEDTPLELLQVVNLSVRPEKIQISLYQPNLPHNCFEGRLINVMYLGTHVNYLVELTNGISVNILQPNTFGSLPDRNTPIYVWWSENDCLAISQTSRVNQ